MENSPTLAELLREDISPDFPVSTGAGSADDPLVITEITDYVDVEYQIIRHVMSMLGEEWEKGGQRLYGKEDRIMDEVVVNTKAQGAPEWQHRRRFHFDITIGFRKSGT